MWRDIPIPHGDIRNLVSMLLVGCQGGYEMGVDLIRLIRVEYRNNSPPSHLHRNRKGRWWVHR